MENKKNITLVVVCNDHFAIMLAALIQSVVSNHKTPEQIELFIIDDHIGQANKNKILASFKEENLNVTWLKVDQVIENIQLPEDNSTFPRNVYIRLFIPSFLPQELKKAIYLDVDMIVCKEISVLWNLELGTHPVAAVKDRSETVSNEWGGITNYKELGLQADLPYFNSGLLVFNMELWRNQNITAKIIDCISSNVKYANFPDQYGLNVVLAGQFLELDYRWNCYAVLDEKDPYIIHFIGNKPIYKSYEGNKAYANEFFNYLNKTEWKNFRPYSSYKRYLNKALIKLKKRWLS